MKKLLLYFGFLFSFLLLSKQADATHYMGGQITWECTSTGQYVFTFKIYRDCSGTTAQPPSSGAYFLWDYPSLGNSLTIPIDATQNSAINIEPNCRTGSTFSCANRDPEAVTEYTRVSTPVSLNGTPPTRGWTVTFDGNARNSNNNMLNGNVPNPYGITLRAKIFNHSGWDATQCIDNSPIFREDPTAVLCGNLTYSYNHNATDEEQDSLAYDWARPLDQFTGTYNEGVNPPYIAFATGFNFNDPYPGTSTLNSSSGEITATLPAVASREKYVAVVKVSAYKCGEKVAEVYRELQSVVTQCATTANNQPILNAPFRDAMGNLTKFDTVVKAGALIRANIQITDFIAPGQPQWDSIKTSASGSQWGGTYKDPNAGCLNLPCATLDISIDTTVSALSTLTRVFEWQTDCNHVLATNLCLNTLNTYNFVVTATDDACPLPLSTVSTISITVEADSVLDSPELNCVNVLSNGNVSLDWGLTPNVNNSFSAWLIYRSDNSNGPFTLIDSVKTYTTNTYTDVNANANSQQRFYHIRSRSGCKGSVINIARDTVATIFLSATTNPTNVVVNWNGLSNPNPSGSAAQYRVFREYPIGTGFNLYQSTANTSLTETFIPCADDVNYRVELVNPVSGCTSSSNILDYNFKFPDPQTNFSFPNNQCPGTPISFTNLTTITGGPVTYSWDFGDGSAVSTQTSPTHTYAAAGNYTVELTATSGQGCDSMFSQTINITLPNADAGTDQFICPGGTANIGSTAVSGSTYSWSPTTGLTNPNSASTTANPGATTTYTVTVTDGNGCTATDQVDVTVIPFPTADAGSDQGVCLGGAGTSIGGSPTGPLGATYAWSSNPAGFTSTLANPTVNPTVNTIYTVTVTIGSGVSCSDTDNMLVTVNAPPTANAGPDQDICPGTSVQIGVAPSAGFTYSWTPTAGLSNPNIANPIATPTAPTTYTVQITETATSCTDTDAMNVTFNAVPNPAFTVSNTCINQITQFTDASTIAAGPIANWAWDFDDASATSTLQNPTHQFSAAGTYQVKLVVTSNLGCRDSITIPVNIDPKPTVNFTFANVCENDVTQFTDGSTIGSGSVNTWRWDFDGLGTSFVQNPTFTFPAPGTYDVKLVSGSGLGCLDSITLPVTIIANPTADAGPDQDICPGTSVQIGVAPTAGFTYSWTPTTGLSNANIANPVATPTSPTIYTVQITETATGCTNTDAMNVTFNSVPTPNFTVDKTCINQLTEFTDASTITTGSITAWAWDFDDASATSTLQNPTHQFSAAGTYQVKLVVTSNLGCRDSITIPVNIDPKPTVNFTFANVCENDVTQFTDGSTIGSGSVNTWRWDFDGLGSSAAQNPTFTFPSPGTYDVKLVSGSGVGCLDSITIPVTIIANPTADAGTDQDICPTTSVQIGVTPVAGFTYSWIPTAGLSNANIANPIATPTSPTTYTVVITETATGCTDTDAMDIFFNAVPTPNFTVNKTCINQITEFTDASTITTGSITAWAWDFDDASATSTVQNPTHQFSAAGTYQVKLVVTSNLGCRDSITIPVTIDPKPTVNFTFANVCENDVTQFTDGSTIGSGSVNTWRWDFDGLGTSSVQNPTFTFPAPGTYNVKLVSGSGVGCLDSITIPVTIIANPTADAGPDQDICPGETVRIGTALPTLPGFTFSWTPTAGLSNPNIASPFATPTAPTTYTVVITETATGCTDTDAMNVTFNAVPTPNFTVDKTCINEIAEFTDASTIATGTIANWAWDFDDASATSTLQNPTHQFSAAGTYQVKLVVTSNLGCRDSITIPVNIDPKPTVNFTFANVCENDVTQFTDGSTIGSGSVNTWRWDFDGLGSSAAQNPTFTFPSPGTYDVKLVSGSGVGCLDSITIPVTIIANPTADAGPDQDICPGTSVQIGVAPVAGFTYSWTPTAGLSNANIANPIATPTAPTTYTVQITETATGCFDTDAMNVTFNAVPTPNFTVDKTCINEIAEFTDASTIATGTIANWAWDFDDASATSTLQNPTHGFSAAGTYQVKLVVTSNLGCRDSITIPVNIDPKPTVNFTFANVCENDVTQFTDGSTIGSGSVNTWRWDFDGLGSSAAQNPTFTFPAPGTYDVKLVSGSGVGCLDSITIPVTIIANPTADAGPDQDICPGTSVQIGVAPVAGFTYSWTPTTGLSNANIANPIATPTSPITYTVQITETATGCFDTDAMNVTFNAVPTPNFTVDKTCINEIAEFTDASTIATGTIANWAWDFDDASATSTQQNPTHQFSAAGTYQVKLVVTSNLGCRDSITIPVTIDPKPTVNFTFANVCENDLTQFTDGSTIGSGSINTWRWDFDGLGSSTLQNPTFTFPAPGTYDVKLVSGSGAGCLDSITNQVIINPNPSADAGVNQDICNTFSVQIGGSPTSSTPNVSYLWDNAGTLDDNTIANPTATPIVTTRYSLTVTENTTGCFDTSSILIRVNPIPVVDFSIADTCVGNTTFFTDLSSLSVGTISSWTWDFGDGVGTSTQQSPSYVYPNTGSYDVKLIVETAIGCKDSIEKTINIVPLPTVDAGIDQTICDRDTIAIGGSPSSSTVGVTYLWDNASLLSDATLANPQAFPNVTTRYLLTVTETATGCFDTASVLIRVNPVPVASFTASAVCENELTQFTDASSIPSGSITSWTWDFGDGVGTSSVQNPTYQYSGAGTFDVKLIVESAFGCKDSITNSITISPEPTPSFTFANLCENDITQFTDASTIATGSITSWSWDFGDGVGTSTLQNPTYTFATPNTYNVKLVLVSDFGCTDSITIPVTINPLPLADAGSNQVICNTGTVQIGGSPTSGTPNVSYQWDNAATLSSATVANPAASPVTTTRYSLTVTENTTGCFDTSSVLVTVNPIPVVDFSIADTCIGNTTVFTDASAISVGSISDWTWDFGDGTGTSSLQNPTYTYATFGTFDVKLIVESALGCKDSITKTINIVPLPNIDAGSDQGICLNDSITIGGSPTSTGTNVSYNWDNAGTLNDNTIANPVAKPTVSTRYKLTVTDLNTGCFDTTSVFIQVNPLPNANFSATKVCLDNTTQFTDLSNIGSPASIQGWSWDFGDNSGTSNAQNPTYQYGTAGTFAVKLVVTTNSGCLDSIIRNVIVDTLPLADAGIDRTICELDTTLLGKAIVIGETYLWDNSATLTNATVAQPGAFPTVDTRYRVTVTNTNGCTSVDSVDITVTPSPNVDAGNDFTICNKDTITIGGSPTSTVGTPTFLWNNASSLDDPTSPNPRAFPSDTTAYVVTVTDGLTGCSSKDTMIVNVNPLANIDFQVDADCEGDFAAFTDISTLSAGSILSWSWDFGDGVGTSALQNPGYQYASPGTYSVKLEVQTALGCTDSIRKDVTIQPLPIADGGGDKAICIGDTITLGGNPTGPIGASYSWSPGSDLSSVTVPNPRAYPTSSTIYYLTVTSSGGCFNYDTVNVAVNALPVVSAEKDSSLCVDQPVQLSAVGATTYSWSPSTYLDNPSIANPIARALKSTNFVVAGVDNNGCVARDTVFIDVFNLDFTPVDTSICSEDSVVLAPVLFGDTNGITYSWSSSNPNNILSNVTDSAIKVTARSRQYFTLQIQNALGCVDTDSIYVNMKQAAEVDFDYTNSPRCQNSIIEIQNISTYADNYIWKLNGEEVSRRRNPDFEINNLVDNTVTLIGSNLTCTDSTTEVIEATGLRELLDLKDANVFTPNGDGMNDIFDPGFQGEFIGCVEFQIFDRWGDKVFDSNIGQYGWDGVTLRGQPAKVGVYFYIIRIGSEEIRGSVYLSR